MKRLDQWLVELGLAPTRSKAQQQITAGDVRVHGTPVTQVSRKYATLTRDDIHLNPESTILKYVSRAGLKLEAAMAHVRLSVSGMRVLDIGLSTGGFTDCLLAHGASEVLGIDVGHDQLHARLKSDARLTALEGVHVRDLPTHPHAITWLARGVDLVVVDVSFISLEHVIPVLEAVAPRRVLALVKPQFEVGPEHLNGKGLVHDPAQFTRVRERVLHWLTKYGFSVEDYFASAVKGQDGNQEFFVSAVRK